MAYPTEKAILDGLCTTLAAGCTGLHPLPYPTPRMMTPAAFPVLRWPLQRSYGAQGGPIECELHVLVQWGMGAGPTLGEYTDPEGAKSVAAAILATPALGVSGVTGTRLSGVSEPKLFTFPGGESYWGRTLTFTIYI